jgi:hypothetical protein
LLASSEDIYGGKTALIAVLGSNLVLGLVRRKTVAQSPNPGDGGSYQQQELVMAAKSSISLVSVQKPTANTPVLQRRNKFTASIEQQIVKISRLREGARISREAFWVDNGVIYFQLRYGKQPLELEKNKSALRAGTWDDLVAQLDEMKTITVAGGLDDALSACANAVRSNFKAAKDKKAAKGS